MGAVAPGLAGTTLKRTTVRRRPFWVPWDDDGKGGIRLIGVDRCHTARLIRDEDDGYGEVVPRELPYYEAKGFIPLNQLPADHEAHEVFAAMCKRAVERAVKAQLPIPDWVPPIHWPEGRTPSNLSSWMATGA